MIKNFFKFKNKLNRGMTYVELIVVLAIFGTMSSILLFRYGDFDKQVSLQNTAQDIAIQIITAQKSAISGKIPNVGEAGSSIINNPVNVGYDPTLPLWKPSYGVFLNSSDPSNFAYFIDGYNDYSFTFFDINDSNKVIKKTHIDKNNKILSLCVFEDQDPSSVCIPTDTLSIYFKRPNASAIILDKDNPFISRDKAEITISDSEGRLKKIINIYSSGKVEII